ncbi:hypothetical protein VE01_03726 [Pseudogymnoascus verrucosus]|uniref:Uncharacterized protein n=1 Tax=Pseudogymnoascus verrucosus TaxID=342668 RepID=A0A1B8GQG5_9PEZI|nr:uncharacterized protein VE01_03726 [Pseudogymnoascus verrucosus]OBT98067.1 hypothetical protein VE01_03726 [Pseudogymnoascus verrucosus]
MAKRNWRAYFRRQEETAALLEQPYTDDEQLPRYSEIQNQENAYGTMDQSPSNVEKSKADQRTEAETWEVDERTEAEKWEVDIIEKWNSETEAEKKESRRLYRGAKNRLSSASNESLEKLMKSDLIELLDIVREEALEPPRPSLAEELDIVRGKSFTTPSVKAQNMPFEKLSKLGLMELLRVARATPFYRIPKSVFVKVPNSDLVDLLREARKEDLKKYKVADSRDQVSRHVEREKANNVHEAKLQEDDQVCKPEDTFHKLPSQTSKTELELKGLKEMPGKIELESDDWLDKVEGQVETTTTNFVEGGAKTKKGTMDQHTKTEKSGIYDTKESFLDTRALKDKVRLNINLVYQARCETDENLEKLKKSDLVEIVDIARDDVFKPYEPPNLEKLLDIARRESFMRLPVPPIELSQCVPLSMPIEELSQLDQTELLRIARIMPYQKIPKSEFMRLSNIDLVCLFREAQKEHDKRYSQPDGEQPTRSKEQKMPHEEPDEAKLQKDDQLYKMGKCVGCGNITPESDSDTCSSTDSDSTTKRNTQVDNKNEPLRKARINARRKTETAIEKTRELHHLLVRLETEMEQRNKTFEIKDFDGVKVKAVEVGRDLDDSILRMEEMLALL